MESVMELTRKEIVTSSANISSLAWWRIGVAETIANSNRERTALRRTPDGWEKELDGTPCES